MLSTKSRSLCACRVYQEISDNINTVLQTVHYKLSKSRTVTRLKQINQLYSYRIYNDSPIHTKLESKNAVTNCITM